MIRKTIFAVATVAAIGAAALIPTEAFAGGKGGGMGGGHHWGHGYWGGGFGGIVVIGPSCWRWVPGLGRSTSATNGPPNTVLGTSKAPVSWREAGALSICKTHERSRTWQQLGLDQLPRQTSAMRRAGPPVASFTFANPTTSMAPEGGTLSRLATFSNPQRPDGNHAW